MRNYAASTLPSTSSPTPTSSPLSSSRGSYGNYNVSACGIISTSSKLDWAWLPYRIAAAVCVDLRSAALIKTLLPLTMPRGWDEACESIESIEAKRRKATAKWPQKPKDSHRYTQVYSRDI